MGELSRWQLFYRQMQPRRVKVRGDGGTSDVADIRNQYSPLGHDRLRRFGKWRAFRGLLAKKPSNDRDGDPADTNYPSEHGDASQGKPCGRP